MDKKTGEIFKKFRIRKGLNSFELSKLLNVSSSSVGYLEDGKTKNPGISIFRKAISVLDLNPYDLYEIITGEVYTEHPAGSAEAEKDQLSKKVEQLEKEIAEKNKLIEIVLEELKFFKEEFKKQSTINERQSAAIENLTQPPPRVSGRTEKAGEHGAKLRVLHKEDSDNGGNHVPP
jgi:transcriptional regulator with XRE-family HTH domain